MAEDIMGDTPNLKSEDTQEETGIRSWLDKSGFPLEMAVAKQMRDSGYRALNSQFFRDADSGQWREIDVVAHSDTWIKKAYCHVSIPLECKSSPKGKAWVLFSASDRLNSAAPRLFAEQLTSPLATQLMVRTRKDATLLGLPFIGGPQPVGYGFRQAHEGRDEAYSAGQKVVKAAASVVQGQPGDYGSSPNFHMVWPVIVVDTSLFLCYLDSESKVRLRRIERGLLAWQHAVAQPAPQLIQIATVNGLKTFCDQSWEFYRELVKKTFIIDLIATQWRVELVSATVGHEGRVS